MAEWGIIMDKTKKYFRLNILTMAAAVVMLISLIAAAMPSLRSINDGVFEIGLPFPFFRVYVSETEKFAAHLGIGAFIGDLLISYVICYIIRKFIKKD